MKIVTSWAAALTLLTSGAAWSMDGNDLVKLIPSYEGNKADFSAGILMGYVVGVADIADGIRFCSPPGATNGQNIAIVVKYLRNNPEKWANSAEVIVMDALAKAYPACTNKK